MSLRVVSMCSLWLPLCGCPSISTMGSARTLQQGRYQAMVAPVLTGRTDLQGRGGPVEPRIEGGIRLGVHDRVEVDGKLWLSGIQLNLKMGIIRPQLPMDGLNFAVAPGVGYNGFFGAGSPNLFGGGSTPTAQLVSFELPLMVGYRYRGHELTVSAKFVDTLVLAPGTEATRISVGGSVGIAIRILCWLRLMPEISVSVPVARFGGADDQGQQVLIQGGIGVLFSGAELSEVPPPEHANDVPD